MLLRAELRTDSIAEQIVAMSAVRQHRWTRAEVDQLIDERPGHTPRYELVDGDLLVTPAPSGRHQRIILQLALLLAPYLTRHKLGEIVLGPGELPLVTGERYEPDLFVLPAVEGRRPPADADRADPLLICEVLSPGSSRHDRNHEASSVSARGRAGVLDRRRGRGGIRRLALGGRAAGPRRRPCHVVPDGAPTALELDVAAFFASVADGAPLA